MDYFCSGDFTYSPASPPSSSSPPQGAVSYNGKVPVSGVFDNSGSPPVTFRPNLHGISMDWTPEELTILEEGLVKYASESSIVRYAKIATHLDNKTIRDVAMYCRWLNSFRIQKKDVSKRRKEDTSLTRKSKERKEKMLDPSVMNSQGMQSAFPPYEMLNCDNGMTYNDITNATWLLIRQNKQALDMISANIAARKVHENIGLLWEVQKNISNILSNLRDPPNSTNRMPDIMVTMNEELENPVLPSPILLMH